MAVDVSLLPTVFLMTPSHAELYSDDTSYLLFICEGLERLSIKDTTFSSFRGGEERHPIPQGLLMNMARRLPNLRWLKSNLTEENVARLQRERSVLHLLASY
jgi:hypothetical protein